MGLQSMGSDEMDPASPSPIDRGSERSSHASQPSTRMRLHRLE
jgi:hypothetical protein